MNDIKYDYLIVGSGLAGVTVAYYATKAGKKCLVLEKESVPGGALYCETISTIPVHVFGPHIFHTSDKELWDFVNELTQFNNYIHSPLANYKGKIYNLPFNMNTFNQLWGITNPADVNIKIQSQLIKYDHPPKNLEEHVLSTIGTDIYYTLIKEYTEKQWNKSCTELPAWIIKRLPIRLTYNNNYFNDTYSGIPINGYNDLINKLLEGSDILLDTDYFYDRFKWDNIAKKIIYTGPIDKFFNYKYGSLEWRSVEWEHTEIKHCSNWQGNSIINYTSHDQNYTRIIEHKHFYNHINTCNTIISKEFPIKEFDKKIHKPYYPVNTKINDEIYKKYSAEKPENVVFIGRCAEYKYYDMAPLMIKIRDNINSIL